MHPLLPVGSRTVHRVSATLTRVSPGTCLGATPAKAVRFNSCRICSRMVRATSVAVGRPALFSVTSRHASSSDRGSIRSVWRLKISVHFSHCPVASEVRSDEDCEGISPLCPYCRHRRMHAELSPRTKLRKRPSGCISMRPPRACHSVANRHAARPEHKRRQYRRELGPSFRTQRLRVPGMHLSSSAARHSSVVANRLPGMV